MPPRKLLTLLSSNLLFISAIAIGQELKVNGFVSTGLTYATESKTVLRSSGVEEGANYLPNTLLGIQYDYRQSNTSRLSAQLLARNNGDSYDVNAEWLYIAYQPMHNWEVQIGRLRNSTYLASEYIYVGQAYVWARAPREVYDLDRGLTRYNGVCVKYINEWGRLSLSTKVFTGELRDLFDLNGLEGKVVSDNYTGYDFNLYAGDLTVHLYYIDFDFTFSTVAGGSILADIASEFKSIGFEYNMNEIKLMGEFVSQVAAGPISEFQLDAFYFTVAKSWGQFVPYFTYSGNHFDVKSVTRPLDGEGFSLGLRYDVDLDQSIKVDAYRGEIIDSALASSLPSFPGIDGKVSIYTVVFNMVF